MKCEEEEVEAVNLSKKKKLLWLKEGCYTVSYKQTWGKMAQVMIRERYTNKKKVPNNEVFKQRKVVQQQRMYQTDALFTHLNDIKE